MLLIHNIVPGDVDAEEEGAAFSSPAPLGGCPSMTDLHGKFHNDYISQ